jgi:hypothetical protein
VRSTSGIPPPAAWGYVEIIWSRRGRARSECMSHCARVTSIQYRIMRTPQLKLSRSTRALITSLVSWRKLNPRGIEDEEAIAILQQIGDAKEPLAIPELMSFGLARADRIRANARSVIERLFAQFPIEELPLLDESLRQPWSYSADSFGMKPEALENIGGSTDADRLFLALATCHHNGYVRAQALRALGKESSPAVIPFVLIRLADWVQHVANIAGAKLIRRLTIAKVDGFVECLGLVARLRGNSRFRPEYSEMIDDLLKLPASADALRRGMSLPCRTIVVTASGPPLRIRPCPARK